MNLNAADITDRAGRHGVNLFAAARKYNRDPQGVPRGLALLTGESMDNPGELVVIEACWPDHDRTKGGAPTWMVKVTHPERTSLDREGEEQPYTYTVPYAALGARMEADGGWYEVPVAAWLPGGTQCPKCNQFMHQHGGRANFEGESAKPWAECGNCQEHVGHEELEERGRVLPLLY